MSKDKLLNKALNLILEITEGDPTFMCEEVNLNYPDYCAINCNNFNKDCLLKYLKYYKKEK